ncbi:ligand-gated ion channel [Chloropicon primus]|uniref:Ligand-gated ion channel n=2 Tax=Chloropicon primus TaxID=1764295 RepID=A0A5B8MQ13_9CHLO|nr:ligand-gated ion channel [Chloropicon primus]UPR00682.1 ligand-gated ion channel [Chloropicon primus]|eukprot:QDZ21470.1 ligand-gated ion channel [Chloropicon primus]
MLLRWWLLFVLVVYPLPRWGVLLQMQPPITGQGGFPPGGAKEVHVSAMLERLLAVDDENYQFESILYLYLSWQDGTAWSRMVESTEAFRNGSVDSCKRTCSSQQNIPTKVGVPPGLLEYQPEISCCDRVWLPNIGQLNVYELPEGRLQPYNIIIDKDSGAVAWWTGIHARYFTPMDFRRFPFDEQTLVMQFEFQSVATTISRFVPAAKATRFLVRGEGDVVSGWWIDSIDVRTRNFTLKDELDYWMENYGAFSPGSDPYPLSKGPQGACAEELLIDATAAATTCGENDTRPSASPPAAQLTSFDIVISIHRIWRYYVLNICVPVLLLVALSLITFIIPAESLDARIALNITLFLSLTALQFVVNDQLPKSSYPTAVTKLVLVCYCCVAYGVPETIVVFALTNMAKQEAARQSIAAESLKGGGGDEGESSNMSIALKFVKRKKFERIPLIIDMASLVTVFFTVTLSTILILSGY